MSGGGELWLAVDDVTLDETAARRNPAGRPGSFICLSLRDTGRGIDPSDLPHIFEPFFTTKEVGKAPVWDWPRCTALSNSTTAGSKWRAIPAKGRHFGFTCHACPRAAPCRAARAMCRGCSVERIHPRRGGRDCGARAGDQDPRCAGLSRAGGTQRRRSA